MFKFLRKHSKWILAIFGTLLMVVFLIPQAITSLSQRAARGSAVWATIGPDEEEIRSDALTQCQNEVQMLQRLQQPLPGLGLIDNPVQWFLLTHEAEQAGLVPAHVFYQIPKEQQEMLLQAAGTANIRLIDRTISRLYGVRRMIGMYQLAGGMSDHRLRRGAEHLFHAVDARTVVIEGRPDADAPAPTEQQIITQFETYKNMDPGAGDQGFGYRLPDRCKLEWLTVSNASIREMIEKSDALDRLALKHHWRMNWENPEKRFPEPGDPRAPIPDIVREDLLDQFVAEKHDAIIKFARDRMLATWRRLKAPDGYLRLPEDWREQWVDYRALAEQIQAEFPGLALPVYTAIGDRWLTMEAITLLPGINMAWTEKYGTRTGPAQLAAAAKEFGGDNIMLVQEAVTAPELQTTDGSIIFFRLTDTDPAHPPAGIEEVRDEVVADLNRKAHLQRLLEQRDAIEAAAREKGLLAVALEHDTVVRRSLRVSEYNLFVLDYQLQNNYPLQPQPTNLYGVGQHLPTIRAIIEHALQIEPGTAPEEVPADQRIFLVPVEEKMCLLLVELGEQFPLDNEHFEQLASARILQSLLLQRETAGTDITPADAFSFETLQKRNNFKRKERRGEGEEGEEGEADEGEPTEVASGA